MVGFWREIEREFVWDFKKREGKKRVGEWDGVGTDGGGTFDLQYMKRT